MTTEALSKEHSGPSGIGQAAAATKPEVVSKGRRRSGWALTIVAGLFLLMDATMKLIVPVEVAGAAVRLGFAVNLMPGIGVLLLVCTVAYLVPKTAVLGAVLLTGFLGGAVAIQMRAGAPVFENLFPVLFAIVIWAGIYLRECRLWSIFPIRH